MTVKTPMSSAEFEDKVRAGKLSRREAHRILASFGVGMALAPTLTTGAAASPEDQPLFFTWAGYDSPEFMVHYVAKYGEEPRYTFFGDEDEAFNKMRSGFNPHVTYPCGVSLKLWNDAGLLAPIDTSKLSNFPDVLDVFKDAPNSVVDGKRLYVPEDWGQTSMIIRTDLAPEYADPANQTWAALWNEKYAGKVAITDYSYEAFAIAALVLGYEPWSLTAEQREACAALLRKQVPLNRMITTDSTMQGQAIASGELVIAVGTNGLLSELASLAEVSGVEWTWATPKEGAMTWHCGLCIHPAAIEDGMVDRCHDLIDSMISPEAGAFEIGNWYYGHVNRKAYEGFDDAFLRSIGQAKDVEGFLKDSVFVQTMNEPERLATQWEELKAGF
ncbi:MAG: extracellular solute-binding protein [Alphaproteobacteria bacterium]